MDLRLLQYFVTVAEERHVGRAAARLHMTQPPLSRAMHRLEADLGVVLLERVASGMVPTRAGETLLREARVLLAHAEELRVRVQSEDRSALVVGSLADAADLVGGRLVGAFREQHPQVSVSVQEHDLGDPAAGLRSGLADVVLTRTPLDATGLGTRVLARQRVGVVLHADDPLAGASSLRVDDLVDRGWVRLPDGADAAWTAYWTGPVVAEDRAPMRTIQECLQAVLWNDVLALAPLDQVLPPGLVVVEAEDREPNDLLLAWRADDSRPVVRSFVSTAAATYRRIVPG